MGRQPQQIKAHSLLEVLVISGLVGLLFLMLGQILWPAFRISARESVKSELLTQSSLILNNLQSDLMIYLLMNVKNSRVIS